MTQDFDANVARTLMQMKIADFLVKPVQPVELVRTCARVVKPVAGEGKEAEIFAFLPGGRRRRRHDAFDPDRAAAAVERPARPRVDLSGRSQPAARRLRRLS